MRSATHGGEPQASRAGPRGTARARLLDAAEELFAAHGFAATTTREIAERAGTSRGMVFYHFPSKEALLETLLAERSPQADLAAILDGHAGAPREALRALARAIDETVAQRGEVLRIMLHSEDPATTELFQRYVEGAVEALARYLHAELGASGLGASQARALAYAFLSTTLLTRLRLTAAPDTVVDDTIEVLLSGYT